MARHVHQYLRPLVNRPIYIGSKASTFDLEVTTVFFSSAHFFVQYDSKMLDVKWEVFDPSFPWPLASQPRNFYAWVPGPGVADSITAANKYTRALQQPLTAGPRSQGQGQRARLEGPSFRVPGVSGKCLIACPKLRVPCPESLISGPRLQHPAFNFKSQVPGQSPKCLASGPRSEFQSQLRGVVFFSANASDRGM